MTERGRETKNSLLLLYLCDMHPVQHTVVLKSDYIHYTWIIIRGLLVYYYTWNMSFVRWDMTSIP